MEFKDTEFKTLEAEELRAIYGGGGMDEFFYNLAFVVGRAKRAAEELGRKIYDTFSGGKYDGGSIPIMP
jgi:bacteriocin-like protein